MVWVASNCGNPVSLPDLPQFTAEEQELFKQQITEREQRRVARDGEL
jgi:hypothetical protein